MRNLEESISQYAAIDRETRDLRKRLHMRESQLRQMMYAIGQSRPAGAWLSEPVLWGLLPEHISLRLHRVLAKRGVTDATYADLVSMTRREFIHGRRILDPVADELIAHLSNLGLSIAPDPKPRREIKLEREKARTERKEKRHRDSVARKAEAQRVRDLQKQERRQEREREQRLARKKREALELGVWLQGKQRSLERMLEEKLHRKYRKQQMREHAQQRDWKQKELRLLREKKRAWKEKHQKELDRKQAGLEKIAKRLASQLRSQEKRTPKRRPKRSR